MRWLWLYLRSRSVPAVAGAGFGLIATFWVLWSVFSKERDVLFPYVVLIVVVLVSAVGGTLAGNDDALDRTAAKRWVPRRFAHLLVAWAAMTGVLLATLVTSARFGPAAEVARDTGGLLGLTALGAALLGAHRCWFLPLLWTLPAIVVVAAGSEKLTVPEQAFTWMMQPIGNKPAALTAAVLIVAGTAAYALRGTPPRPASDPSPA
ncbi:hypothetical protein [Actinoplanes sp. NPDC051859]|uniref:hypothetical protein n=1 Tax=Actinoplanes sp. NPDC051859 TaxID=3363909 RepID=UPI0037AE4F3A